MNNALLRTLTHIRNAIAVKSAYVNVPKSNMVVSVLKHLKNNGFIQSYKDMKDNIFSVKLLYTDQGYSVINGIKVISKSSIRTYIGAQDIKPRFAKNGMYIISTNVGILSSAESKKLNVGGEILFLIW